MSQCFLFIILGVFSECCSLGSCQETLLIHQDLVPTGFNELIDNLRSEGKAFSLQKKLSLLTLPF